ncbi:unnamed protein product [Urochloa decumbens]|uniref:Uncharacterized protein n=1 Tax=Urochloa decumbens TaxID=240449 RepID=A0ABC9BCJ7_9POAL
MAGTGAAAAPPQALPPAPGPAARRGAAAAAPRGHLELATDALRCCLTGATLVCNASCAAFMASRGAFGRGSRAVAVAGKLFMRSFHATGLLLLLTVLSQQLLGRNNNEARVAPRWWQIGGGGRGRQDVLRRFVTAPTFSLSFMFMAVGLLTLILAPGKEESYMASVGYMVGDVGCFLHSVAFCLVVYPELLVQLRSIYAKLKED